MAVYIATTNVGKIEEFKALLPSMEIMPLNEADKTAIKYTEESGSTYIENAVIKAKALLIPNQKRMIFADDSGIEIDYFDGAPGICSHRWKGKHTYIETMDAVLRTMENVPDAFRGMQYHSAIAMVIGTSSNYKVYTGHGVLCGSIAKSRSECTEGFGYDAIFDTKSGILSTFDIKKRIKRDLSQRKHAVDMAFTKFDADQCYERYSVSHGNADLMCDFSKPLYD